MNAVLVPPHYLETYFAQHEPSDDDGATPEELTRLEAILDRLDPAEADILELYLREKMTERGIGALFGVSQQAVSWRLFRIFERIDFLLAMPVVTEEEIRADLGALFEPVVVETLVYMAETTCQVEVAALTGLSQSTVRKYFLRAVERLEADDDPRLAPYRTLFSAIARKRWNILRPVKMPPRRRREVTSPVAPGGVRRVRAGRARRPTRRTA